MAGLKQVVEAGQGLFTWMSGFMNYRCLVILNFDLFEHCMKGEKISTPLEKDGRGPCGLHKMHTVKALPPTLWCLYTTC